MAEKEIPSDIPMTYAEMSNGINHAKFKKSESILEPVYRLVGMINKAPTAKEMGTVVLLGVMVILFIVSVTGFCVMWFTEFYDNSLVSRLILVENSSAADMWINPPVNNLLKVHIFNYTNIDSYLSGEDEKIKLVDLGPYTYEQFATKTNVKFNSNHTVTFNDHRSYKFRPELSNGSQTDEVIIPNIPLMTASVKIDQMPWYLKNGVSTAVTMMNQQPFIDKGAHEFLWGYTDPVMKIYRTLVSPDFPEKFGMLRNRNGTSPDTLQIYTGENDLRNFGLVSQFNGMPELDFYKSEECNRIDGSDASQFPPYLMENREDLDVFTQALCRKLPLRFHEEVTILDDIDAWRYVTPTDVFLHPNENPDNLCYCQTKDTCLPSGVFNGTLCYNGAPIYPSFPHFFTGDPKLYSKFEGISPNAEEHQTFADIHPRLAFPINGASRIQINVMLHKGSLLRHTLRRLENDMILPVLWLEITVGEINEEIRSLIFHSTFSANLAQTILKYGTLLICIVSFTVIVISFYNLGKLREEHNSAEKLKVEIKDRSEIEHLNGPEKAGISHC